MNMNIEQLHDEFLSGECTSVKLIQNFIDAFNDDKNSKMPLNAFLEIYDDALKLAQKADDEIAKVKEVDGGKYGENTKKLFTEKPLLGIPFAVKDNISVKGKKLTCASKIMTGYVSPYNATVIQRLIDSGAIPLGRCNQDEFSIAPSTETSCYGITRNPVNRKYTTDGSAAVVASNQAIFALGTDSCGSVRLSAGDCGIYGLKTSYGVLSRFGVVGNGSSLAHVGIYGHTPSDIALSLSVMAGKDFYDDTSCDLLDSEVLRDLVSITDKEFASLNIAVPKQFLENNNIHKKVLKAFEEAQKWFKSKGAKITVIDLPFLDASEASYNIICFAETASSLSRFDGIRFGKREDSDEGYDELYIKTRSEGFGMEVKRDIIIGNYILSEQLSGDCYKKSMKVRAHIQKEMEKLFENYDLILCPTLSTNALLPISKDCEQKKKNLFNKFTTFVNMARIPAINVPAGFYNINDDDTNFPIGMQFIGKMFSEITLLRIAKAWENDKGCQVK
ncbi:MAG: Asp-tRNA(Asn)/Glu-tRNA(Gln) amidotransferase subunit GatA [Treponema sp.]|nr:Asp-tRNA(Asn)/Glu-tRNA(Gln) amidotransferase subunit GatA [Treponema sp.]